jgi:homogentisate 1,2-dioxygenase
MKQWIPFPRREGFASKQAHVDLPEGTFEREISKEGFFGPATEMYHRHPPTGWSSWDGPLRPRAFDLNRIASAPRSPWGAADFLLNAHVRIRAWRTAVSMDHLVRNADGDDLLFFHTGRGELYCDYGHLAVRDGDYVMLPRGTMWRLDVEESIAMLLVEATNASYRLPDRGIAGQHSIFDPGVLETPAIDDAFRAQQTEDPWRVVVKRRGALSTVTYPWNPLDAAGWQGTIAPVRLNWRDIRPLASHRVHVPPSAHTTFLSDRFVVCTFCPRPIESDPGALKVPFFHNNDDYDEVIFYHAGNFFSRDNIVAGMATFHPGGFTHGPHPKALAAGAAHARKETDEVAVMVDARDPLDVSAAASDVEWAGYVDSWKG